MLFSVDLIEHDGNDLRDLPLIKRRLKKLLPKSTPATSSCPPILGVYVTRTWANARCCLIFTSIQRFGPVMVVAGKQPSALAAAQDAISRHSDLRSYSLVPELEHRV